MNKRSNLCPVCRIKMELKVASGESDVSVNIDWCPKCGGFWFDNQELFVVSPEIAKKYDSEIIGKKFADSASHDRICPRCEMPLILLKDPELSQRLQIDICPKCMGLWLDQGEFLRYKEYQKEKIEKAKKADALRAAENLRKFQNSREGGRFWKFLMRDPYRAMQSNKGINVTSNLESVVLWLINSLLGRFKRS
ncbi:MAG: zf-TFIIB domain-containing protein [candidate division WOR-3 bacterium]|nr:zf-TFIIB domain-containing protein [candidate division WOR-3 bacterium]MDH5683333.1 zf-TFIIB domain-containing protein [candidate division WOR-3 bacterium]